MSQVCRPESKLYEGLYQVGGAAFTEYNEDAAGYLVTDGEHVVEIDPGHPPRVWCSYRAGGGTGGFAGN